MLGTPARPAQGVDLVAGGFGRNGTKLAHLHFHGSPLSRGSFLRRAAGAGVALAAASGLRPAFAAPLPLDPAAPSPIPGGMAFLGPGTELYHANLPMHGPEQSSITDFRGFIGTLDARGTGTGRNTATGETKS